jgi:hypothetical protein
MNSPPKARQSFLGLRHFGSASLLTRMYSKAVTCIQP